MSAFVPFRGSSGSDQDENEWWLDREISLIKNLLEEEGETTQKEIGTKLGCKYWGPTRFRNALREGVKRGAFRRNGRNYAPAR